MSEYRLYFQACYNALRSRSDLLLRVHSLVADFGNRREQIQSNYTEMDYVALLMYICASIINTIHYILYLTKNQTTLNNVIRYFIS